MHIVNFCFLHSFYFSNFQVFKPYLWDPLKNKKDWFKINPQCYFTLSNTVYSMLYLHTLYLSHTRIHSHYFSLFPSHFLLFSFFLSLSFYILLSQPISFQFLYLCFKFLDLYCNFFTLSYSFIFSLSYWVVYKVSTGTGVELSLHTTYFCLHF